ncbi:hypothetical protein AUEXF2481DRAFT_31889 [Aureobasidium subglaciale EXF-2481]|uniref:DUF7726 domain-containing protein n=1 Tax=Aureobasidium subglaciale (strain EXF-2481) TaxID=1043005 RepID=A0A074Y4F2_AURSE|nr:uncharacterized protein AUEXF2481DRAFT_31889 [Aureobasidium subglaciale EXF-2481]KEQ92638.1 hypothetical protein AUEXF2481DRAFT_31889 [Aureobasidium subglaciale EXF-2481]
MKVTDFCSAIGASSNLYYNFMHKHGTMKGADFAAYPAACSYFQKREDAGLKPPTKKQKTKDDDKGKSETTKDDKLNLCDVHSDGRRLTITSRKTTELLTKILQGEETDSVPRLRHLRRHPPQNNRLPQKYPTSPKHNFPAIYTPNCTLKTHQKEFLPPNSNLSAAKKT